ncbi:traB domain-containing protein [Drosophila gunungcola]|uniref:traB domain-containing protein n=1 Tax=Drosophila gunungcola TaxID=103775 RepID=UPI0022E84E3F|nr:traB domain-containing protein [Drosophila gunungcola]XP_052836186.1 traB domain-containing protein [Drosophila gunungcola]XP_052836187.1 traB domain-containing protein [Drosophila gunungcola]XP_052836188.1 traB domain-containing protein [Drosophila gunungcola]XP_052836189.1 traB domain-containing protein [Drosophila gunungcola]
MDVSASTSFEASPDKRSSTYVGDNTLYDSALDHQLSTTAYKSCNESLISELSQNPLVPLTSANKTASAEFGNESAVFKSFGSPAPATFNSPTPALNASMLLIQSESTDTNTSQEEVDPKSQLANKTIFKTDNPNLSIIEINDNSIKEEDLEKEVVLVEGDNVKNLLKKSPSKDATASASASIDKRRRKESLLQTSKQKLDISIAEASAAADGNGNGNGDGDGAGEKRDLVPVIDQPQTKRDITIYDTIEEFEQNLPSTVTLLNTPFGSKVYLVGTAHFSEESQDDVSYVIRNVRPDVVMVELCPSRIHILKLDEKTLLEEAKSINIPKIRGILHTHGYINGIFFILLLQMSAQIAKDLGMAPGGEFRRAFEEIHKLPGCILHLGDRPIRITLYRALRALSLWQTMKLVWRLTFTDSISIEEVEECKQSDLLEKLMQEMAGEFPAFSDVFVRERDIFLCHSLQLAALPQAAPGAQQIRPVRVVGVVGIGHANGIAKMWGTVDPKKIPAILEIPPASLGQRVCTYTLKYGLIGLGCYGAFRFFRPRLTRFF